MSNPTAHPAPRQNVQFSDAGAFGHGYLALPPVGSGPGVILIQEWWGLTDHIADLADRLAEAGFVVLAPDLYGGRTTHDAAEARRMMVELPVDRAAAALEGAVDYLLARDEVTGDRVGAVGFCMGGGFVLLLAARAGDRIGAVVPFYGVGPGLPSTYTGLTAAVLGHYGVEDHSYPVEQARALEDQLRRESQAPAVRFEYYDAGHAFHNDANAHGYDPDAAALAWARTVAFLHQRLDG